MGSSCFRWKEADGLEPVAEELGAFAKVGGSRGAPLPTVAGLPGAATPWPRQLVPDCQVPASWGHLTVIQEVPNPWPPWRQEPS